MDPWANGASSSFGPRSVCSVGPIFHLWSDVWVPIFKPYQVSIARFKKKIHRVGEKVIKWDSTLRASTIATLEEQIWKRRAYSRKGKGTGEAKRMDTAFRRR